MIERGLMVVNRSRSARLAQAYDVSEEWLARLIRRTGEVAASR